jgi:alpha-tubulin suppressor-like RCC1 family protein
LPQQIEFPQKEVDGQQEVKISQCSAGYGHTAAISENGNLYMWGFNIYGQLGTNDMKSRMYPEHVS